MKILEKGLVGLAVRRKRAGFTQQSFADALGIERARYANYEIGVAWPPAGLLPGMASLLGCSIDDLYVPVAEDALCHSERSEESRKVCTRSGGSFAGAQDDRSISDAET